MGVNLKLFVFTLQGQLHQNWDQRIILQVAMEIYLGRNSEMKRNIVICPTGETVVMHGTTNASMTKIALRAFLTMFFLPELRMLTTLEPL